MKIMSDENSSNDLEQDKKKENPFLKGWGSFVSGIKDGFKDFQNSLEDQTKKNQELWENSKEKSGKFFKKVGQEFNKKIESWKTDMERKQLETKEQWENRKKKIHLISK